MGLGICFFDCWIVQHGFCVSLCWVSDSLTLVLWVLSFRFVFDVVCCRLQVLIGFGFDCFRDFCIFWFCYFIFGFCFWFLVFGISDLCGFEMYSGFFWVVCFVVVSECYNTVLVCVLLVFTGCCSWSTCLFRG